MLVCARPDSNRRVGRQRANQPSRTTRWALTIIGIFRDLRGWPDNQMPTASGTLGERASTGSLGSQSASKQTGARGRSRTGTTVRLRDFRLTSTFAASASAVRGLEHAFTVACGRRCPPSALYTFPWSHDQGLGSALARMLVIQGVRRI
jgi:hypothetical protein